MFYCVETPIGWLIDETKGAYYGYSTDDGYHNLSYEITDDQELLKMIPIIEDKYYGSDMDIKMGFVVRNKLTSIENN